MVFFIQNKIHWQIHRHLRGPTVSEKAPKIPFFGTSLIHQSRLLDLSNIHKVESFYLHFQVEEQKILWQR